MNRKTILITAGPTKEYIDPVRFISNDSSGKMGYLLAEEAKKRGAKVILISGPVNLPPPKNVCPARSSCNRRGIQQNRTISNRVKVINVVSAEQMFGQVIKHIKTSDVFISCAAVSDYKPEKFSKNKIKKTVGPINLKLIPNPDILMSLTQSPNFLISQSPIIVGFALESENVIKNATKKLKDKKLDMIIANTVNSMNSDETTGAIITKSKMTLSNGVTLNEMKGLKIEKFNNIPKKLLAKKIIGRIL
ncbi:MAG: phosphopantothenoylcysteine decarboxylase [Elusimicrobiota bacterium]